MRKTIDWAAKVGDKFDDLKELVEFCGFYRPSSGGPKALFKWKCLLCDEIYGPSQYGDIKRLKGSRCCSSSKKHGSIRWGFKTLKPEYMRSLHISATKRNLDFEVTAKYLYELLEKQNFVCKYTGIPLILGSGNASVDRIDSKLGYIEGNVQWVYTKVNYMKWDSTEEEFLELCSLIASRRMGE